MPAKLHCTASEMDHFKAMVNSGNGINRQAASKNKQLACYLNFSIYF